MGEVVMGPPIMGAWRRQGLVEGLVGRNAVSMQYCCIKRRGRPSICGKIQCLAIAISALMLLQCYQGNNQSFPPDVEDSMSDV